MGNGAPLKSRLLEIMFCPGRKSYYISCRVYQFANDNNVFIEFHMSYCVIKDVQT